MDAAIQEGPALVLVRVTRIFMSLIHMASTEYHLNTEYGSRIHIFLLFFFLASYSIGFSVSATSSRWICLGNYMADHRCHEIAFELQDIGFLLKESHGNIYEIEETQLLIFAIRSCVGANI